MKRSFGFRSFHFLTYYVECSVQFLGGLATPAEAAGVGAFGAIVLSFFYKTLEMEEF